MAGRFCGACGAGLVEGAAFCGDCGASTADGSGASAPVVVDMGGSGDRRRWWWVVLAAVVAAVAIGAVVGVALRPSGDSVEVVLEPVGSESADPFTESVVSEGVVPADLAGFSTSSSGTAGPSGSSAGVVVSQVAGDRAGLYGSSAAGPVCSPEGLALRVAADPEVAEAWAAVAGIDPGGIDAYLKALTPVVLGRDTAVTNHEYGAGGARAFQSVLEAGTPVLVDATGAPRVRCSCGNPLLAPEVAGRDVDLVGERWDGFDPQRVSEVRPAAAPVTEIETVDVDSGDPVTVALGGGPDTVELDGLLVADDAGVHVHSETGERLATVLDQPVDRVFDDGAGGLIYNLRRPDDGDGLSYPETTVPGSAEEAAVWHLPAGATDPVELIGSDDPSTRWAVAEAAGTLGGRRVLVYADMTLTQYPGLSPSEFPEGPLVVRDLESGEDRILEDVAFGWEQSVGPISILGDRIAYPDGGPFIDWTVRDAALETVPTPCLASTESTEDECAYEAALADESTLVGLAGLSETGESTALVADDLVDGGQRTVVDVVGGNRARWDGEDGVDAHEGRAVVWFDSDAGSQQIFPAALVDTGSGAVTEIPVDGQIRFLRSPLIRPADVAPPAPAPDPPPPPSSQEPTTPATTEASTTTEPPTTTVPVEETHEQYLARVAATSDPALAGGTFVQKGGADLAFGTLTLADGREVWVAFLYSFEPVVPRRDGEPGYDYLYSARDVDSFCDAAEKPEDLHPLCGT